MNRPGERGGQRPRLRRPHADPAAPTDRFAPGPAGEHPGAANYPVDGRRRTPPPAPPRAPRPVQSRAPGPEAPRTSAYRPPPTHNPHLDPLADHTEHVYEPPVADPSRPDGARAMPRKLTVTRVAALRGRELTSKGIGKIQRAATADGADRSGLTALTLPVILNNAVDAAMTVALANTLFFAAASAESKGKVALYLALTIAPFALIAPLIGPALDKLQRGRRIAMATTFGVRVLLALLIMTNAGWDPVKDQLIYDPWVLYPCALGLLVLSKSFGVLKSAVTPRVLPPSIDLVRVNSRLTTWGLVVGTVIGGGVAALFETMLGQVLPLHVPGAMVCLSILAVAGAVFCMRIPAWVEVTAGEIPATLSYHGEPPRHPDHVSSEPDRKERAFTPAALAAKMRQPLGRNVLTGLWGNGTIRILTGFLTLYIAFWAKSNQNTHSGWMQLAILGAVGAAAGVGNFVGNATGTRAKLSNPQKIVVSVTGASLVAAVLAAAFGSILFAALAALVASGTSAIGKVCLDSSIQDDLPDESRASAFGRSESVLQLCWVIGAALGVLLPSTLWVGFTVVSVLLALGMAQTFATYRGATLVPGFGGRRPEQTQPTGAIDLDRLATRRVRVDSHEKNGL